MLSTILLYAFWAVLCSCGFPLSCSFQKLMSRDLICLVVTLIPLGVVGQTLGAHGALVDVVVVLATRQAGVVGLAAQEVVVGLEIQDLAAQEVVVGSETQGLAAQVVEDLAAQVAAEVSVTLDLVAQAVDLVTQALVAQVVVVLVLDVLVDLGILAQVGSVAVLVVLALVASVTGILVDLATHLKAE